MRDVVIVGAGPVGLFLANRLVREGLDVEVCEKRTERTAHSRAIGIHPPSLRAFEKIGIVEDVIASGVQIHGGELWSRGRKWGKLSFRRVCSSYPFVLSVPQHRTEKILEDALTVHSPEVLRRDSEVVGILDHGNSVEVMARTSDGTSRTIAARLVIGADGRSSVVRSAMGSRSLGRDYRDHYVMGDFHDTEKKDGRVVLYCEPSGMVESFPLPGGVRRWVLHMGLAKDIASQGFHARELAQLISARTGVQVAAETNSMLSHFDVRARHTDRYWRGNMLVIGDAAHEVSPIGGQGMNLGWLDAEHLVGALNLPAGSIDRYRALTVWEKESSRLARKVARRAEWNMSVGRPMPAAVSLARNLALGGLAASPLRWGLARRFTMQDFLARQ